MKKYLFLTLLAAVIMGNAKAQTTKLPKGFTWLFDGKTTKGWHSYGKKTAGNGWEAQNGILHLNPKKQQKGDGDLLTDKAYGNFHLKLDWKIATNGNSGIIFLVHEELPKYKNTYATGPEMQILDNNGHPDGKITKHRAGDLYDLIKSHTEPVKPAGQWNTAEIIAKNGNLTLVLNGIKVVKTTMWDKNWKNLIAQSKFATWENFGTFKTGKIALQDHGDEVWFKNIMIKEL